MAKAYEGYRREAIQIDKRLAGKLFGSALDRLEELPLRYVENSTHGSPLHELAQTNGGKASAWLDKKREQLRNKPQLDEAPEENEG